MSDTMAIFRSRLYSDWLPSFCQAPHRNYSVAGFKDSSISKLHEFDAYWFLRAIDAGLVTEKDGFFIAPKSKAKEQIFWEGDKKRTPRPITLWIEPIITIGALARLNQQYGWPIENLGMQSATWAFDLVGYSNSNREHLVCEVKKQSRELSRLLDFMNAYARQDPLKSEPVNAQARNAYRKVQGIRLSWPTIFWALGPGGEDFVSLIRKEGASQRFQLEPAEESILEFSET